MLKIYFQDIFNTTKIGDATEESYYPDLKRLFENWGKEKGKKFYITPLPKRTEAGNPDFRIWDGKEKIVGYIEAKAPTVENLEVIERSEQLERYRHTFPNLLLTNFFEFRLYRNGELINSISIGRPFAVYKLKIVPPVENQEKFLELLERFFAFSIPRVYTAKTLAAELAKRTRFLRDQVIIEELKEEEQKQSGYLLGFYKAFKDHLIATLTQKDFANLYAQTITYGLFVARSRAMNGFNRKLAYDYIPHTIGILRDVFKFVSLGELPISMEWIVDDIAEVLAVANVKKIMYEFYKEGKGKDPVIHFYETFLAEYDPTEREKRGVYYTPEPVVSYIVHSTHQLLKEKFGKEDGFATKSLTVLDPAAGTLTFLAETVRQTIEEYKKKFGDGGIKGLIKDHILKNFYAFELMMAPYAVGHLKIGFVLEEFGYKLSQDERFNLYLTNTLDFTKEDPNKLPGILEQTIAKESGDALDIKENIPIMVIMGNPPYSGASENKGDWILKQIEEYKEIEGKSLGERNPKWIQDDYVKFFRFAQWKIEKTGIGILGFITNHAWLDNPTFRGMRYSLLKTFDEIYILNLHGSTLKKERTPQGSKDENVFDIRPGVAIAILIKLRQSESRMVYYSDRWGLRKEKYDWLQGNSVETTKWKKLTPSSPYYFFVPKEEKGFKKYQSFPKITNIFQVYSVGVVTARDNFVIDFSKQSLEARIRIFRDSKEGDDLIKEVYKLKDKPTFKWYVAEARRKLRELENWEEYFTKILYRPFDERWIYYHSSVIERTRENVMRHMLKPNLALIVCRQYSGDNFYHALVADTLVESCYVSNKTKEIGYTLPLYLYSGNENKHQQISLLHHEQQTTGSKKPNIDQKLMDVLRSTFGKIPTPEEIFYYIYAILYSKIYRQKYQEFLKIDFPRISFTKDYKLFQKFAELGKRLVELHLIRSPELNIPIAKFYGKNGSRVEKRKYREVEKRVYINNSQYFEGVTPEVWHYYIGGYQVLDKWLKDRRGRTLSSEEIKLYCKIVTTLSKTIELQKKIDELYPDVEKKY